MGASLYEFRDLDIMLKLRAEADGDGWIETAFLAQSLGFDDDKMPIAQRLSWMKRYGMVEFNRERKMWRLTEGGERVTNARLRAAHSKAIERIPDESMVEVMSAVTTRYVHGSPMLAQMLRREFLYGTQPGRRR
jgi:hypothetical protein